MSRRPPWPPDVTLVEETTVIGSRTSRGWCCSRRPNGRRIRGGDGLGAADGVPVAAESSVGYIDGGDHAPFVYGLCVYGLWSMCLCVYVEDSRDAQHIAKGVANDPETFPFNWIESKPGYFSCAMAPWRQSDRALEYCWHGPSAHLVNLVTDIAGGTVDHVPTCSGDSDYFDVSITDSAVGNIKLHATRLPSRAASKSFVKFGPRLSITGLMKNYRTSEKVHELFQSVQAFVKP